MKKWLPISLPTALLVLVCLLGVFHAGCSPSTAPGVLTAEQVATLRGDKHRARAEAMVEDFYAASFDNHLWVVFTGGSGHTSYSFQHHPDCRCQARKNAEAGK